jgi:hypothetical protein
MSLDAAFGFQTPDARALAAIDSTKYPDTNKDMQQNMIRLNQFVDYIASYLQTMQKGIDKNNQDPIAQIQGMASDLLVLLGGGELLYGIDLGDLQYFLPAIGALLGFDTTTPFPINLFNAAEHFLLGYVVPLNSFGVVIEGIIDGWAEALGIDPAWIASINDLLDAFDGLESSVEDFLTSLENLLNIFGTDFPFISEIWHGITTLLGGLSLDSLGSLIDPAFKAVAPWIEELAQAVNQLNAFIESLSGGVTDLQGVLNFTSLFSSINFLPSSGTFDPIAAITSWLNSLIKPTNMLAFLSPDPTGATSAGVTGTIPLENLAMEAIGAVLGGAQSLIDAILEVFGYAPGSGTEDDVAQIFSNIYDLFGNPANFTEDIFNVGTAIQNFITDMLHPTNMLAPMDPVTSLINSLNIPGLDATKIVSGVLNLLQIPGLPGSQITSGTVAAANIAPLDASKVTTGVFPQSMVNITSIAASIITGTLNALQIPGLDATKIVSGIFGTGQIPNLPASQITSGTFLSSLIPGLDATKIISGIFGLGQIPGLPTSQITSGTFLPNIIAGSVGVPTFLAGLIPGLDASKITTGQFPQAMVNITSIAASIITGTLNALQIPGLDATKIVSGIFGQSQIPSLTSGWGGTIAGSLLNSAIAATNVPSLDASKITTGQFAQSMVNITSIAASIVTGVLGSGQIPGLDATKIISGIFGTAQIPGLPASQITSGTFGAGLIPVLDASKIGTGTFADAFVPGLANRVLTTVFQSKAQSAANLVIDPGFDNATVWANEPGVMDTAQKVNGTQSRRVTSNATVQSIALSACGGSGTGPIWAAQPGDVYYLELSVFPKATNVGGGNIGVIASIWDSTGVNSFNYVLNPYFGAPPASGTWTKLSGYLTIPAGYDGMIPYFTLNSDVPNGDQFYVDRAVCFRAVMKGMSPDLQSITDQITNSLLGYVGTTNPYNNSNIPVQSGVASARASMDSLYANFLNLTTQIQNILTNSSSVQNSQQSQVNIDFSSYANGALPNPPWTVVYTTLSGTPTSTIGVNGGNAGWTTLNNDGNRQATIVYNVAPTNTDYQLIKGSMANPPSGTPIGGSTNPALWAMGRVDSPSNPRNYVWAKAYCTGFLTYKCDIGYTAAGVDNNFQTGISLTWSTDITVVIGANGNPRRYQGYSGTTLVFDYTEAGTGSQIGAGFRYWGLRTVCVNGTYGAGDPGSVSSCSISDNAPPTVVGSGARITRVNTATVNFSASSNNVDFPNQFFDTQNEKSGDITAQTAAATLNRFTASIEGWYYTAMCVEPTSNNTGGGCSIGIKKNGTVYQAGQGARQSTPGVMYAGMVYLKANDYITPMYNNLDLGTVTMRGGTDGSRTWWVIVLLNKSLA